MRTARWPPTPTPRATIDGKQKLRIHRFRGGTKDLDVRCGCNAMTWDDALRYWRTAPRADIMEHEDNIIYCDQGDA